MLAILVFVDHSDFGLSYQRVKIVLLLFPDNVYCRPLEMPPRGDTRPPADDM